MQINIQFSLTYKHVDEMFEFCFFCCCNCFYFIECPLRDNDHPLDILQRWGSGRLVLRYTVLSADGKFHNLLF